MQFSSQPLLRTARRIVRSPVVRACWRGKVSKGGGVARGATRSKQKEKSVSHYVHTTVTSPCRRPCASFPRCEVLDLRGSGPGWAVAVYNRQQPRTPPTNTHTHTPARVRTHSTLGLTTIANDQPLHFPSFMRNLPRRSHCPRTSRYARRPSFSSSGFPPFSWPAVLSFLLPRVAPAVLSFCLLSRCAAHHTRPQTTIRKYAR